jgi:hypothetical protein
MHLVSQHVQYWSALLEMQLRKLTWDNGAPRRPSTIYYCGQGRNRTRSCSGFPHQWIAHTAYRMLERIVSARGYIALCTGCFCNPGSALKIVRPFMNTTYGASRERLVSMYMPLMKKMGRLDEVIEKNRHIGFVRVSFGLVGRLGCY